MPHTISHNWITIRQNWIAISHSWITILQNWIAISHSWITIGQNWIAISHSWITIRQNWIAISHSWITIRHRCNKWNLVGLIKLFMYILAMMFFNRLKWCLYTIKSGPGGIWRFVYVMMSLNIIINELFREK